MRSQLCVLHRELHKSYECWKLKRVLECYSDRVECIWDTDGVWGWDFELKFHVCGKQWRVDDPDEYSDQFGIRNACFECCERSSIW